MIKSMTGFGRCEIAENNRKFTVEIKSVNHRYLDVNIKMPKALNFFESAIRGELKSRISRGKVDVFVSYEDYSEKTSTVRYNKEVAQEYLKFMRQMGEEFGLEDDVRVSMLARFPEVFTMEEAGVDEEELWKELRRAVAGAAVMFVDTRIAEGSHLKEDLLEKLRNMTELVEFISGRMPQIMSEYRRRLEEKVRELLADGGGREQALDGGHHLCGQGLRGRGDCEAAQPYRHYGEGSGGGRLHRQKAGLHRTGDEPGGQHHSVQGQ